MSATRSFWDVRARHSKPGLTHGAPLIIRRGTNGIRNLIKHKFGMTGLINS